MSVATWLLLGAIWPRISLNLATSYQAQEPSGVPRQLVKLEQERSDVATNLEYLCDMIGPRLTGSRSLKKANEWAAGKMREYGLENVRQEPFTIPARWERRHLSVRVTAPVEMDIPAVQAGWTRGIPRRVTGRLILFSASTQEDLDRYRGKLKGAILIREPFRRARPSGPDLWTEPASPEEIPAFPSVPMASAPPAPLLSNEFRIRTLRFFEEEGVLALLASSNRPYQFTDVLGSTSEMPTLPRITIGNDSAALLHRLLRHGPVRVEVESGARLIRKPNEVYNSVCEIRGTDLAAEQVVLGAHLDSWDLGVGATDNGTGCTAVMEAARLLKTLGLRPRRTIRFVLFTGEEQGLLGSKEYVRAHKDELAGISTVFVLDNGTGRVQGVRLEKRTACRPWFEEQFQALSSLGLLSGEPRILPDASGSSDHAPFHEAGVPAFEFLQDAAEYGLSHHTVADTLERVRLQDVKQGACVMAILAWNAANIVRLLPR